MLVHLRLELLKWWGLLNGIGLTEFTGDEINLRSVLINSTGETTCGVLDAIRGWHQERRFAGP